VQLRAENELRAAFRAMGAVSPATARAGNDLVVPKAAFDSLLRKGAIREGAPGTYYLYQHQAAPRQLAQKLLFWTVVILLPIGIIELCSGAR